MLEMLHTAHARAAVHTSSKIPVYCNGLHVCFVLGGGGGGGGRNPDAWKMTMQRCHHTETNSVQSSPMCNSFPLNSNHMYVNAEFHQHSEEN